ncbi:unnamed protein product [Paramecium pentaurelia]|uniref:Uncharacterized protein n=1 Tax=Paramecium pentaurelia TaxID=43138 RepID=A0A8S1W1P3_9CILI|nr:unnamed protein product [Paramecium pentaurelia]
MLFQSNPQVAKNLLGNRQKRFEHTMKSMQKIKTFVDLTKRLKLLNPLQFKQVQIIIQHLKQQAKLRQFFKKEDDEKNHIIAISKQLELEIDMLNNIENDEEKQNLILDILQLDFSPNEIATMVQESSMTLETHHNLHRIQETINKRNLRQQSKNQVLDQINNLNFLQDVNNDSSDFYKETIKSFNSKRHQQQNNELSVNEKFELLKKYLLQKGIQIEKKEKVPHQEYSKFYAQQANKLIKSTKLKQLKQIHVSSPKSASISPELLHPQSYHTNHNFKKMEKLESNYQTSNNVSSTTLNTPQLTPSKLLKQKSEEFLSSQQQQSNTERIIAPKRKSDHQIISTSRNILLNPIENEKEDQPIKTNQSSQPQVSYFHKSIDQLREFQANTKAVQTFFRMENKDSLHTMREMEKILKKPLKQHFNEFMSVHQEENDGTDCLGKRKNNMKRNIRLNKIFKSELE